MRWRSALIIAACMGHACFVLDDCGEGPTPVRTTPPNPPPVITGLSVTPLEVVAGRPVQVSATITDGDLAMWSLSVSSSSQATGTFSVAQGFVGDVSSQFSPALTSSGQATLQLAAIDREGGQALAEVTVFVAPRR